MTSRIWILGAADPEMAAIEELLSATGEKVTHAIMPDGRRVSAASAYSSACTWEDPANEAHWDEIITVECEPTTRATKCIDHHRPGDLGYGRPPSEFLEASSIGQVCALLGRPVDTSIRLVAAADHCLGAAYRGECPGVDPDHLMRWRVESRAAFQGRTVDDLLADVQRAMDALAGHYGQPETRLAVRCLTCHEVMPETGTCRHAYTHNCYEAIDVRDLRGQHLPELPEAACRAGIGYVAGPLSTPDGRKKIVCSGSKQQIEAFLHHWAPSIGLVDTYGDPARGFAGGYLLD